MDYRSIMGKTMIAQFHFGKHRRPRFTQRPNRPMRSRQNSEYFPRNPVEPVVLFENPAVTADNWKRSANR